MHLYAWFLDTLSLTTSMLMIASCMCHFHQVTLLQHWMAYNHAWHLSNHGCRWINWNWTQIGLNSSLLVTNGNGANITLCLLLSFLMRNSPSKICSKSRSNFWQIFRPFWSYISAICSATFYHIRDLRRIQCYLDLNNAKLLANTLVSSRLDHSNSLLSGIADTDLTKLQRVQNRLARVETQSPPYTRSVPLLRSLHWLPVKFRVDFKICLLTYQTLSEK